MDNRNRIKLGADLKFTSAKRLVTIYQSILNNDCDDLVLDVSDAYWVTPFTACWIVALVDKLRFEGSSVTVIEPTRSNAIHQWHNLGISYYLGLSKEIKSLTRFPAYPVAKLTEPSYALAGKVKDVLVSSLKGADNFYKALHFAVREIVDNSFDHAQIGHCYICANAVPTKNVVRMCILDTGIGIPKSMRQNLKYENITDDVEIVEQASRHGVTSKRDDRGIGLYILRDVVENRNNEGYLSILSGKALLKLSVETESSTLPEGFPGTIIKLQLRSKMNFYYMSVGGWDIL